MSKNNEAIKLGIPKSNLIVKSNRLVSLDLDEQTRARSIGNRTY